MPTRLKMPWKAKLIEKVGKVKKNNNGYYVQRFMADIDACKPYQQPWTIMIVITTIHKLDLGVGDRLIITDGLLHLNSVTGVGMISLGPKQFKLDGNLSVTRLNKNIKVPTKYEVRNYTSKIKNPLDRKW